MPLLPLLALALGRADLTSEVKTQTIDGIFAAMRQEYVFPEIATKAEAAVRQKLAAHAYDGIADGPAFAKQLTEDLKDVCHDAHLRVRYSAEPLPERKDAGEPSPAEIEEGKRFERLDNGAFQKVERLTGNVGYIRLDGFYSPEAAKEPLRAAMAFVARTDALIIDLRNNGGGDPSTVQMVCSYLFDKPTLINSIYFRPTNKTTDFWTSKKVPGPKYLGRDVYVLTSKRTGSGAEECTYDLQTQKRATIVGESTWGGANPGHTVRLNDHFGVFVPVGRAINPITKTNWEGTGVTPDIKVASGDALKTAQVLAVQKLLANADAKDKARLTEALDWVRKN